MDFILNQINKYYFQVFEVFIINENTIDLFIAYTRMTIMYTE